MKEVQEIMGKLEIEKPVTFYRGAGSWFLNWICRSRALVLGHRVFIRTRFMSTVPADHVIHELAHVDQVEQLGLIRFLLYYLHNLWKYGYDDNFFEVDAENATRRVMVELGYTGYSRIEVFGGVHNGKITIHPHND